MADLDKIIEESIQNVINEENRPYHSSAADAKTQAKYDYSDPESDVIKMRDTRTVTEKVLDAIESGKKTVGKTVGTIRDKLSGKKNTTVSNNPYHSTSADDQIQARYNSENKGNLGNKEDGEIIDRIKKFANKAVEDHPYLAPATAAGLAAVAGGLAARRLAKRK